VFERARTLEEAVDEIETWADSLPGDFSVSVTSYDDSAVLDVDGSLIASALLVHVSIRAGSDATVEEYRFHVQTPDGQLVWREDCHSGHEHERGMHGPEHAHRPRGSGEVRRPAKPATLESIREPWWRRTSTMRRPKATRTERGRSWPGSGWDSTAIPPAQ
jgi:hypothetical protein